MTGYGRELGKRGPALAFDRPLTGLRPRNASFRLRRPGPGSPCAIGRLVRGNLVHIAFGQRDVVPTVEQARAVDWIDGEAEALIAALDRLPLEIDAHGPAWLLAEQAYERRRFVVRDDRGQQSVLRRVASKDVAEGWRDHAPDAVIAERIDRRLARGAAAEVATAHDDLGTAPGRSVERKIRLLAPVGIEAQIVQQRRSKSGRARHLQKARREELIGVEIGDVERAGGRSQPDEFVHARLIPFARGAAAARRLVSRSPPLPRPSPETSNECARPVPAVRGNFGWWSRRSAPLAPPRRH